MGGVVPTANQQERAKSEAVISLYRMHRHMRLFQHNNTGEVLVLVNQDIAGYLGPEFVNDWFEVSLSRLQDDYLRKLKVLVSVPGKNTTFVEDAVGRNASMDAEASPNVTLPTNSSNNNTASSNNNNGNNHHHQRNVENGSKSAAPSPTMLNSSVSLPNIPPVSSTGNSNPGSNSNNSNSNQAPPKSNIPTGSHSTDHVKDVKQEPDVLKRLKVLKNAAMEGKSVSMDSSIEFSGSRQIMLDYAADAKPSRPHFKNNGEKSRSRTQLRAFVPTPYYPLPSTKPPEDLQVNSFSYNNNNQNNMNNSTNNGAKDTMPSNTDVLGPPNAKLRNTSVSSSVNTGNRSLNLISIPCPNCGMVFFGCSGTSAVEEHQWTCYAYRELNSALELINTYLRPVGGLYILF